MLRRIAELRRDDLVGRCCIFIAQIFLGRRVDLVRLGMGSRIQLANEPWSYLPRNQKQCNAS
jgi:hypothetical protein